MAKSTESRISEPNILFLFTDQQRPDWLGTNPEVPVQTPNLDALADRGTQFTNAVCPSPVCNPSRACIASGMEYDRCGVPANTVDYPVDQPTYQQRLRDQAVYHVMGCGKFDLTYDFPLGLSGSHRTEQWGFSDATFNPALNNTVKRIEKDPNGDPRDPYTKYLEENGLLGEHIQDYQRRREEGRWTATFPTPLSDEAYYDNWITRQGLALLADAPDDKPWFLQVNFQNPHDPWDITERMHDLYREPDVTFPSPVASDLDVLAETHQEVRRNYAAMIEHLDECVGRFLNTLEERGELKETLVVFSSDHGEMLGDHGQWQKLSPLQASVGVPLIIAGPDVVSTPPREVPATILDLHATFLDYAGITPPANIDSRSMRRYLAGETTQHRDMVYSGLSSWRMVYDGQYKLIKGYDPDLRREAWYEPMHTAPENIHNRKQNRETILHEPAKSEQENVAGKHLEVFERLSMALHRFSTEQ